MYIKNIRLFNFRNFSEESTEFNKGLSFIRGKNGQGKTNLIEAIYILSTSKSFRTSKQKELLSFDTPEASIFAEVESETGSFELGIVYKGGKKYAYINQDRVSSLVDFIGRLSVVCFTPGDLELVKGSPGNRRSFIDHYISTVYPEAIKTLIELNKAIKSKASILRNYGTKVDHIVPWNEIIVRSTKKIEEFRLKALEDINRVASEIHKKFSSVDGDLTLSLVSNFVDENNQIKDLAEYFNEEIIKREIAAQKVLYGPHRDDIKISLEGKDTRSFASQGQSRSIVLSLKLSLIDLIEEKRGERPVVLLDDVNSELDEKRSESFFELLLSQEGQVLITGTDVSLKDLLKDKQRSIYEVSEGKIDKIR